MSVLLKLRTLFLALCLVAATSCASHPPLGRQQFLADFDVLWSTLAEDYAYFDGKTTDWRKVRDIYRPLAGAATDKREFVGMLERTLDELYDPHTHLKANTAASYRLIPTGLDVWAEWRDGKALVTQVRRGFSAEQAGMRTGMEILAINGTPVADAVRRRLGRALTNPDAAAFDWALRSLLAGTHDTPRVVDAAGADGVSRRFSLDQPEHRVVNTYQPDAAVEWRRLPDGIGYIALHDLGSDGTVAQFDEALEQLRATRGLILDLRDTPSGGNTSVAEPILGRFIQRTLAYQRIIPHHGAAWAREVSPRGEWQYTAPLVVLVDHWTGSMGEGMAIGLDGMGRATVAGTRMAGLNGAVFDLELPNTRIRLNYAAERLAHLDGTPREYYVPSLHVDLLDPAHAGVDDPVFQAGIALLQQRVHFEESAPGSLHSFLRHPSGTRGNNA